MTFNPSDRVAFLGSCFATNLGNGLAGVDCKLVNPFGNLYNPASILRAVQRLDSDGMFTPEDCVEMGAGAGKICSFEHHTSFARESAGEFLKNANEALANARIIWKSCNKVVVVLGNARVWKHLERGVIVSNCLKRPGYEFEHYMLKGEEIESMLRSIVEGHPEKQFEFRVVPILYKNAEEENALSEKLLSAAIDSIFKILLCFSNKY